MNESTVFKVDARDTYHSRSSVSRERNAMQTHRTLVTEMPHETKKFLIRQVRKAALLLANVAPGGVLVSLLPNDEYGEVYWLQLLSSGSEVLAITDRCDDEVFVKSTDLTMADVNAMLRWLRARKAVLAGFHVHILDISVPLYGSLDAAIEMRLAEDRSLDALKIQTTVSETASSAP